MYNLQCMPIIKSLSSGADFPNKAVHLASLHCLVLWHSSPRVYESLWFSTCTACMCFPVSFLTLQSFTYEDCTSSYTCASARTAFLSTPVYNTHIFWGLQLPSEYRNIEREEIMGNNTVATIRRYTCAKEN